MIIWGWGKVTKKIVGGVFERTCNYCNMYEVWNLCIVRTWFTLFFIPIIPYKKEYCIACQNCWSYIKLTEEEFKKIESDINASSCNNHINSNDNEVAISESMKYNGKTETQINYLKQMEEYANK